MHPAPHLLILFLLIPINVFCATTRPCHDVASPKSIRDEEDPIQPSTQPFSTQPIRNNISSTNTATPPLFTFHLLDFRAIMTSSRTEQRIIKTMERTCEVFAYYLFDYDVLDAHDFVLRFGAFTLEYHDVVEILNILAIKAVVTKLMQMVMKGLLGFVKGEMVNAQAGVRMIFAFGVLGGGYGI